MSPSFIRFSSNPSNIPTLDFFPLQPIPEISRRVKALNQERAASGLPAVLLHTDAAQALGKRRVDVEDLGVDFLTIVGHKVRTQRPASLPGEHGSMIGGSPFTITCHLGHLRAH